MATINNSVTAKYTSFNLAHGLIDPSSIQYIPDNICITFTVFGIPTIYNFNCHSPNSYRLWAGRFSRYSKKQRFLNAQIPLFD